MDDTAKRRAKGKMHEMKKKTQSAKEDLSDPTARMRSTKPNKREWTDNFMYGYGEDPDGEDD